MAGRVKTALILGASRGIGKQIALTFAENGYKVCVAAKTTESTPKLPGMLKLQLGSCMCSRFINVGLYSKILNVN